MPSGTDHKTPVGNAYRGFFSGQKSIRTKKYQDKKVSVQKSISTEKYQNKKSIRTKKSLKAIKDSNK